MGRGFLPRCCLVCDGNDHWLDYPILERGDRSRGDAVIFADGGKVGVFQKVGVDVIQVVLRLFHRTEDRVGIKAGGDDLVLLAFGLDDKNLNVFHNV